MGSTPARGIGYWSVYKLAGLPTQSPALLRAIERELRATTGTPPAAANVFDTISNRLLFVSNSPSLRAALYRVIAHLPGVRLLGWRTDRIGRRGIAVAISHRDIREELLFDPATSEVLQTQEIQVAPFRSPKTPPLPAGTVLNYTVFISRGIVNSIKDLPGGGHVQFHPFVPGR
jgi:hypothetical protein